MKKYVYCYYDKVQEAFTQPLFQDLDPVQMSQGLSRAIKKGFKLDQLTQFNGLVLYHLGDFDDSTGDFVLDKRELLDCDVVLKVREEIEASKKVEKKEGDE